MQQGPSSAGQQDPWGRSRCEIDTSSPGNRFYAPPEEIPQYQVCLSSVTYTTALL